MIYVTVTNSLLITGKKDSKVICFGNQHLVIWFGIRTFFINKCFLEKHLLEVNKEIYFFHSIFISNGVQCVGNIFHCSFCKIIFVHIWSKSIKIYRLSIEINTNFCLLNDAIYEIVHTMYVLRYTETILDNTCSNLLYH